MNEREIFDVALAVTDPSEQAAVLERVCGDDTVRRRRIQELLDAQRRLGSFLESPPVAADPTLELPSAESLGTQIGNYKLLELIGEGGMGLVYMAEQQRPVRRLVALKIIKPGAGSRQVIARFEAERQALAMMDHPGIAKILEAGTTAEVGDRKPEVGVNDGHLTSDLRSPTSDLRPLTSAPGRPYFVMELVRGLPITEFCDHKQYTIRQRLELFIQVCQAVQHAHQKGIIHRDLKPTNVLVTMADATPVPKIIDFGIAKALENSECRIQNADQSNSEFCLLHSEFHTGFAQLVGTPLYMSPEQADLNALGVDTRSDVYSLGVMLYELLTGTTPFDKETLKSAGFDEIRRIIREEEPETVSQRLARTRSSRQPPSAVIPDTSSKRFLWRDGTRSVPTTFSELDWIVARCLEKDRNRRYESASSLAADLERYLADEPVDACPPSALYNLGKFARRKKGTLITIALVAAALVVGLIGTSWQALRATNALHIADERYQALDRAQADVRAESQRAKTQAAIAQAVNDFFNNDVLGQADPTHQPDRDIKLKTVLDRAAAKIGDRFQGQPLTESGIRFALGKAYNSLYEHASAEQHLKRAYELRLSALGEEHLDTLEVMNYLAGEYLNQRRYPEADAVYRKALAVKRRVLGNEHVETLKTMSGWAVLGVREGRVAESELLFQEAFETGRCVLGEEDPLTINVMGNLGSLYLRRGRSKEGEALIRRALELHRRVQGAEHPATIASLTVLANFLNKQGRPSEAEPLVKEALETAQRVQGEDHPLTIPRMFLLAQVYQAQGRDADAAPLFEMALEKSRRVLGAEHPDTLAAMSTLAGFYYSQHRFAEAQSPAQEVLDTRRRVLGRDHADTLNSMGNLVLVLLALNELDQAVALLQELHVLQAAKLGPADLKTLGTANQLATYLLRQKKFAEAEPLLRQCVEISASQRPDDWIGYKFRSLLGDVLVHQAQDFRVFDQAMAEEKFSEAEPLLLAGYEGLKVRANKLPSEETQNISTTVNSLVRLYTEWGKPAEVAKWQTELDARDHPP